MKRDCDGACFVEPDYTSAMMMMLSRRRRRMRWRMRWRMRVEDEGGG
jgi:hypothetical protein